MSKEAEKEAAKAAKEAEKDSVTVVWRGKTRTYTRSVHGEKFAALAKEFADKVGGTVK